MLGKGFPRTRQRRSVCRSGVSREDHAPSGIAPSPATNTGFAAYAAPTNPRAPPLRARLRQMPGDQLPERNHALRSPQCRAAQQTRRQPAVVIKPGNGIGGLVQRPRRQPVAALVTGQQAVR